MTVFVIIILSMYFVVFQLTNEEKVEKTQWQGFKFKEVIKNLFIQSKSNQCTDREFLTKKIYEIKF